MSTMVSPVKGYRSSAYGYRGGTLHAGVDIGTGGVAAPVYAAFAGVLSNIVRGRKRYQPWNVGPTVAPYRTGDGLRVHNPDGEQQLYIHMRPLDSLQNGDRVTAGQLLGYVNLSGNTSGYHLHFEVWNARGRTRNPEIDFHAFGLDVGETPKKAVAPAPKPKPKPDPKAPSASVKRKLKAMGLPQTAAGVGKYQKAHGLFVDNDWGSVTERYYQWVRDLQQYLNGWKAVQRLGGLVVDGYRGSKTKAAERAAKANDTRLQPYSPPRQPPKRA